MGRTSAIMLIGALACAALAPPAACAGESTEYEVKAAFLFNFAKFVSWPETAFDGPESPIVIGILGDDPFNGVLEETVAEKTVGGRALEIRRFEKAGQVAGCHILFTGRDAEALRKADTSGTLTVGETASFAEKGGVVEFYVIENRVHFEINARTAEEAGLIISSKLLSLARIVGDGGEGGDER